MPSIRFVVDRTKRKVKQPISSLGLKNDPLTVSTTQSASDDYDELPNSTKGFRTLFHKSRASDKQRATNVAKFVQEEAMASAAEMGEMEPVEPVESAESAESVEPVEPVPGETMESERPPPEVTASVHPQSDESIDGLSTSTTNPVEDAPVTTRTLRVRGPKKVVLSPEVPKTKSPKKTPPRRPLTYTTRPRKANFLNCCFVCDDNCEAPKKTTVKVKKEKSVDDNEGTKEMDKGKAKKKENGADASMEEKEDEADAYVTCAFKNCPQVMHKKCADEFVCSEYSPNQAKLLFLLDGPVCPAHVCWHCYEERMKNTSRFGELIDCEKCMRSFHIECLPAGCKITSTLGKRKSFLCHEHSIGKKKISRKMRTKYCTECEQLCLGDEVSKDDPNWETHPRRKMECKQCTNVFHRECAFREVRGEGAEEYQYDTCPYCLIGGTIVANQYVQAYYPHKVFNLKAGYYPAVTLALKDVPKDVARRIGDKYGVLGYIPVKWMWNELDARGITYYNMVHKSQVQRMTLKCGKNICEKKWKDELMKASVNFKAPTRTMDYDAMRKTIKIIRENVYTKGVQRILRKKDLEECTCKPDKNGVKCNDFDCHNRASCFECPTTCDEAEGIKCANREMQRADRPTDIYEVRVAGNGKGLGVFATKLIKKGKFLFEYAGELVNEDGQKIRVHRTKLLRSNDEWTYMMDLKGTSYIVDARFKGSDARYVNNSCDPNCEVSCTEIPVKILNADSAMYEPRLKVMAKKDIQPGEEITFAYGLFKTEDMAMDACVCGADNCKGKLGEKKKEDDSDNERFDDREELAMEPDEDMSSESEGAFVPESSDDDANGQTNDDEKENKRRKKKALKRMKKTVEKKATITNRRRASMGGPSGSRDRVPSKRRK
ncbi:mes-4 [Pristionchus pacificus]|nr:mes-4 [Pristionchus pacificus]|eukprot:PDM70770.1 mes-4 [Pristionchus pacificus]